MKIFIPVTDDMLDDPAQLDRLVPYQVGVSLLGQLQVEEKDCLPTQDPASARHPASPRAPQPSRR